MGLRDMDYFGQGEGRIVWGEGPEDHDIIIHGKNLCRDCANRHQCRQSRLSVTDCPHYLKEKR
jgi:hypothetical protein